MKAQFKFADAVKRADENLLRHFESEINKLKKSSHAADKELVLVVEGEKEAFKNKGLVPWSRPMRNWLKAYGKELSLARESVGKAFDTAIDRAKKSHDDKLEAALLEEAGQTLAPREVATWEIQNRRGAPLHRVFYSDGTYTEGIRKRRARVYWAPPTEDAVILEFPARDNPSALNQQAFFLTTPDGKTLTTVRRWQAAHLAARRELIRDHYFATIDSRPTCPDFHDAAQAIRRPPRADGSRCRRHSWLPEICSRC